MPKPSRNVLVIVFSIHILTPLGIPVIAPHVSESAHMLQGAVTTFILQCKG